VASGPSAATLGVVVTEPNQTSPEELRAHLRGARRVVIKIGSNTLMHEGGCVEWIAAEIAGQVEQGRQVVLVSSGAIALGLERLGMSSRPRVMPKLQAAAAVGQSRLMQAYDSAFRAHGLATAQVLLTHAELADRERYLNARSAIDAMLDLGAVPIINENDTVAVDEIRFGDNDQLAAMVGTLVGADLLVLLTDVEGVQGEGGQRISVVRDVAEISPYIRESQSDLGSGGMASKVEAARRATRRGVPVLISGERGLGALERIFTGDDIGTLFLPTGARLPSRKHWIAYTLKPRGAIVVDAGAATALTDGRCCLLPAGVIGARGDFSAGDAVAVVTSSGDEIARGLTRYGTRDVAKLAGAKTSEIAKRLGHVVSEEVIHRDDLVLTGDESTPAG